MKFNKIIIGIILFGTIVSCKKNMDVSVSNSVMTKTIINSAYGSDSLQKMDIYLPAGRTTTTTKVIVMIHGGAWSSGDKTDLSQYVDTFKRRLPDYAIFNLNYRLAVNSNTVFPAQENDIKDAVQYIIDQSSSYLISNKIVIMGVSAGAHLGLLEAYKNMNLLKAKAVVSFFGPTDLIDMYNNPANPYIPLGLQQVIGATPIQDSLLYASSSPINYVNGSTPPTLILQGGLDNLVRPSQAVALQNKLNVNSVANQYVFYPNEGHGWFGATLSDSFDKLQAFLNLHVQ